MTKHIANEGSELPQERARIIAVEREELEALKILASAIRGVLSKTKLTASIALEDGSTAEGRTTEQEGEIREKIRDLISRVNGSLNNIRIRLSDPRNPEDPYAVSPLTVYNPERRKAWIIPKKYLPLEKDSMSSFDHYIRVVQCAIRADLDPARSRDATDVNTEEDEPDATVWTNERLVVTLLATEIRRKLFFPNHTPVTHVDVVGEPIQQKEPDGQDNKVFTDLESSPPTDRRNILSEIETLLATDPERIVVRMQPHDPNYQYNVSLSVMRDDGTYWYFDKEITTKILRALQQNERMDALELAIKTEKCLTPEEPVLGLQSHSQWTPQKLDGIRADVMSGAQLNIQGILPGAYVIRRRP